MQALKGLLPCRYHRGGRKFAGTVLEQEVLPADWLCSWSQNLTRNLLHLKVRSGTERAALQQSSCLRGHCPPMHLIKCTV